MNKFTQRAEEVTLVKASSKKPVSLARASVACAIACTMLSAAAGAAQKKVDFQTLAGFLPHTAAGVPLAPHPIEQRTTTSSFYQASVMGSYNTGRGGDITVIITDYGTKADSGVISTLNMVATGKESATDYDKLVQVDGRPVRVQWHAADERGDLEELVAGRFLVTIRSFLNDKGKALDTLKSINIKKLESLKGAST